VAAKTATSNSNDPVIAAANAAINAKTPYDTALAQANADQAKYGSAGKYQKDLAALKALQNLDPVLQPLKKALGTQTTYLGQVKTSFKNFDDGFSQLTNAFQGANVNTNDSQVLNTKANDVSKLFTNAADLRAFNAGLQEVRSEYSNVVARGSTQDNQTRDIAAGALPQDVSIGTLMKIKDELQAQGKIIVGNQTQLVTDTTNQINDSIHNSLGSAGSSGGATSGLNW
jgi:hypothetical protein